MHKALRSMNVQGANGHTRRVKRGEKVPEAKTWKNLRLYIEWGYVTKADGTEFDRRAHEMAPRKKLLERLSNKLKQNPGPAPISEPEEAPALSKDAEEPAEDSAVEKLLEMKKSELVETAELRGLDTKYLNKRDLAKVIVGSN